ncbi:MAG: reverse transcriptase domain-containing protein [archaeon]
MAQVLVINLKIFVSKNKKGDLFISKNHNIFNNTFKDIVKVSNIKKAFKKTQEGNGKYNNESIKFKLDYIYNINKISTQLKNKNYIPDKYNIFQITKPKERTIAAPSFRDKLIQFSVHRILNPIFENKFIYNSYSCINNKGTHKCAQRTKYFLRKASWKWNTPWILKADIKKFFYNINHKILKNILSREIKDNNTLYILFQIINYSPENIGLPLGNITSQLFANVYLNELDQYIKCKLSKEFYCRYMDDFICVVRSKKEAKQLKNKINIFIKDKLNIEFNKNKTQIFPVEQGVNFTGYKIWKTHMLLRKKSKKTIKTKLKKIQKLFLNNDIPKRKVEQILNSWKGHSDFACNFNFKNYLINRFNFIEIKNDKFIVKEGE